MTQANPYQPYKPEQEPPPPDGASTRDSVGVLRVRFQGSVDLPLPPDAQIDDEQELAGITSQAIAGMTADDWASAVRIEGTELLREPEADPAR